MKALYAYLATANVITALLYGADRAKARRGAWRIPERVLLGCGICGGALGALLGMRLFHHKTRHWYFTAINTAALLAWAALLAYRNGVFS